MAGAPRHAKTPQPARTGNAGQYYDHAVVSRRSEAQSPVVSNQGGRRAPSAPPTLLPELYESQASERIAELYAETRSFSGVASCRRCNIISLHCPAYWTGHGRHCDRRWRQA